MRNESQNDWPTRFHPIESDADWDAQGWRDEPEQLTAAPELGAVISIRLDPASARMVAQAARKAGLGRAEFARRTVVRAAASLVDQQPRESANSDDSGPLASNL